MRCRSSARRTQAKDRPRKARKNTEKSHLKLRDFRVFRGWLLILITQAEPLRCSGDVDVPAPAQELEVADEVEILRPQLEFGEADDLGQASLAIAPV